MSISAICDLSLLLKPVKVHLGFLTFLVPVSLPRSVSAFQTQPFSSFFTVLFPSHLIFHNETQEIAFIYSLEVN